MKEQIQNVIKAVCRDLFHVETGVELTHPDTSFGDYSTNLALKLSKQLNKPATEIASMMANIINNQENDIIEKVTVAEPGFINITLTFRAIHEIYSNANQLTKLYNNQIILVEFGDANPFKEMHLGHLYNTIEGDTISSFLEENGAVVKRLSYHGDVGLQVAKWIWGIGSAINWDLNKLDSALTDKPLGQYYSDGSSAYDNDEATAKSIRIINKQIYNRDDDKINTIYDKGRAVSFKQFDDIFKQLHVKYHKKYLESDSDKIGIATVNKYIGSIFDKSEGAIVYRGEKVGLHTRVFITSQGLPTYETKDLGLVELKHNDFPEAKKSIVITANEQAEYFKVMLAALNEFSPTLASITTHLSHGFVSLTTGKMSSRTGNVYSAARLLNDVRLAVRDQYPKSTVQEYILLAAVRYTFLKQKLGSNIIFDIKESVSLEGNSGPYIQYAHARARSLLKKSINSGKKIAPELKIDQIPLQTDERHLAMKISEFPEVFKRATEELMPHHICNYLYELSQEFNSFYESNRVINDSRMFTRLHIVGVYADVLKKGMQLLNIPAPDHM